jgi:hypothetical protein
MNFPEKIRNNYKQAIPLFTAINSLKIEFAN